MVEPGWTMERAKLEAGDERDLPVGPSTGSDCRAPGRVMCQMVVTRRGAGGTPVTPKRVFSCWPLLETKEDDVRSGSALFRPCFPGHGVLVELPDRA